MTTIQQGISRYRRMTRRVRKPFHLFERDSRGEYTIQSYDPIGSVIAYLRNERWNESRGRNEAERIYALRDAIELANNASNL